MKVRALVLFAAASLLPLSAFQAPAPAQTPAAATDTAKRSHKKKDKAADAAPAAQAAPAAPAADTGKRSHKKDKAAATPAPAPAPTAKAAPAPAPAAAAKPAAAPKAAAAVSNELVGNSNSKICHRADCKDAGKISAAHRVAFASAADAQAKGYRACKICKPF